MIYTFVSAPVVIFLIAFVYFAVSHKELHHHPDPVPPAPSPPILVDNQPKYHMGVPR